VRKAVDTAVRVAATQTHDAYVAQTNTAIFEGTLRSILNSDNTATPTASPTPTITPTATRTLTPTTTLTPTLDNTQQQQAFDTAVSHALTQTRGAFLGQTGTAAFQATVKSILNRGATATRAAQHAAIVAGLRPITVDSVKQLKESLKLYGHTASVQAVAFSPDGAMVASAGLDKSVRFWDVLTGIELKQVFGISDRVSVAFSPDGTSLAAASPDGTVRVLDVQTGSEVAVLRGHTGPVRAVAFSPDGHWLASAGDDRTVRLWSVQPGQSGQPVQITGAPQVLQGHRAAVYAVAFSPDGTLLASGSQDASVFVWEAASGVRVAALRGVQRVFTVAFSPDGTLLASGGDSRIIQVWDISTGRVKAVLSWPTNITSTTINSLAFSVDGSLIVAGGQNAPNIGVWDAESGKAIAVVMGHAGPITSLAFSPEGVRLIHIWTVPAG
jgi:WD40 repeat protein